VGVDFNREKYQKMVNYVLGRVGGVLALYPVPSGHLVKNCYGDFVRPILATQDLDEFRGFVVRYMKSYKCYPDYPILEFNEKRTLVLIKPSYKATLKSFKPKGQGRGVFYEHLTAQEVD